MRKPVRSALIACCIVFVSLMFVAGALAADWARFRGPNGSGLSTDDAKTPVEWSQTKNLKWKFEMPGPGSSSPIVVGKRVLVTCWSGYGVGGGSLGDQKNLKRHIVCIDRESGKELWSKAVDAVLPEDSYRGMFAENGYASHTPVSDGERVYAFFGKSGVYAYDLDGKQLWSKSVGTRLGPRSWGSASSPILYKDMLIVTASSEDEALIALNKKTGEEVWNTKAGGFSGTWGTPIMVKVDDDRQDLVLGVPYEIWGINPDNGKLRWYCEASWGSSMCSSVIAHDGVVYGVESGPDGGGMIAVRAGGKGDVTKSHVVWSNNERSRIGTPLLQEGRLYWISSNTAKCADAKTGKQVYQARLQGGSSSGGGGSRGGGGRFGGGRGGQDYSSPIIADGKIYYTKRGGDTFVVALGSTFKQLARNRFESDNGDFSASPAISDGQIFIRSSKNLYCIANSE